MVPNLSKFLVYQRINSTQPIEILSKPKYQQYPTYRNTQYTKVSIVSNLSKYCVLCIAKYQQYPTYRNTQYIKVSIVHEASKFLIYQNDNSTQPIETLSELKYQQYATYRNILYTKVSIVPNLSKYLYIKVSIVRVAPKYFTYQNDNSTQPIETLSKLKYQQYATYRNTY